MFEQLLNLDRQLFLLINGSNSVVLDGFAMTETSHFAWIPFVLTLFCVIIKTNDYKKSMCILLVMSLLYLISSTFVSSFVQPTIARLRPAMDLNFVHLVDTVNQTTGGFHGMFSHQASKLMAFTVFLALLFRSLKFFVFGIFWTLLHSWVLLYLGYYYPFDILIGLMWGVVWAVLCYILYFKLGGKFLNFRAYDSEQCTSSGYYHVDIQFVNLVFLLNLIGIIIVSFVYF